MRVAVLTLCSTLAGSCSQDTSADVFAPLVPALVLFLFRLSSAVWEDDEVLMAKPDLAVSFVYFLLLIELLFTPPLQYHPHDAPEPLFTPPSDHGRPEPRRRCTAYIYSCAVKPETCSRLQWLAPRVSYCFWPLELCKAARLAY
jgi:hypothetical protein